MNRLDRFIDCRSVANAKRRVIVAGVLALAVAPLPLPAQEIDTLALESHVGLLADDLLEGRAPGTRGERMAALYLVSQLRRLGLEPLTERGYRLPVPLTAVEVDLENAVVRLSGDGQEHTLRPPAFYHPGGSRSAFRGFSGDLVFAGPAAGAVEVLTGYEQLGGKIVVLTPPWTDLPEVEAELLRRGAAGSVQVVPNESFYDRLRLVRGPTRFFLPDGVDDPANQRHLPVVVGGGAMISALGVDDIDIGDAGGPVALHRRFELELPFTTEQRTGYKVRKEEIRSKLKLGQQYPEVVRRRIVEGLPRRGTELDMRTAMLVAGTLSDNARGVELWTPGSAVRRAGDAGCGT